MDPEKSVAVVVGSTGGIGAALVEQLAASARYSTVLALSRGPAELPDVSITRGYVDVTDEHSVRSAASQAAGLGVVRLVVVASGLLRAADASPEKSWTGIDPTAMARLFAVNTIGPALIAKHFLPLIPAKGRSIFAVLSARVGSIQDNQLGGWHSYRASKAALNMLVRNFGIELVRRSPEAICIALHPGTVDTALSKPFQRGVRPDRLFSPARAAGYLLAVVENAQAADNGGVFAWDGARVPA